MSTYVSDTVTIWRREMLHLIRSKSRVITSLMQPIFWLVLMGTAFNEMFAARGAGVPGTADGGTDFITFLAPGIVAMTVLFSSVFSGISVIFDREFGFLKEILVAPVSRESIVMGKALGGSTTAVMMGMVILGLSTLIGATFEPDLNVLLVVLVVFVTVLMTAMAFVNMGIAFASKIESMEGFQMVVNFLVLPMFFVSGAFYPIDVMPGWLQGVTYINPLFYGVDALRNALNGAAVAALPLWLDLLVLVGFTAFTMTVATWLFKRSE